MKCCSWVRGGSQTLLQHYLSKRAETLRNSDSALLVLKMVESKSLAYESPVVRPPEFVTTYFVDLMGSV
jgi:hypothetical protein